MLAVPYIGYTVHGRDGEPLGKGMKPWTVRLLISDYLLKGIKWIRLWWETRCRILQKNGRMVVVRERRRTQASPAWAVSPAWVISPTWAASAHDPSGIGHCRKPLNWLYTGCRDFAKRERSDLFLSVVSELGGRNGGTRGAVGGSLLGLG